MSENSRENEKTREQTILEIQRDIENYERAIANAEGALDEAERELQELLADSREPEDDPHP